MDPIELVKNGNYFELVIQLINGLDPNYKEEEVSLLHYAVVYNQYDIAKLLINWGANPDLEDVLLEESPRNFAYQIKDYDFIEILCISLNFL